MRTTVTIHTDCIVSYRLRPVLDVVMGSLPIVTEQATEETWVFPTSEQAAEAVKRIDELKQISAGIRVSVDEDPGVLDGGEKHA